MDSVTIRCHFARLQTMTSFRCSSSLCTEVVKGLSLCTEVVKGLLLFFVTEHNDGDERIVFRRLVKLSAVIAPNWKVSGFP
jgi:hypothetical protein